MNSKDWACKLIEAIDAARRSGNVVHEHELTDAAFDEAMSAEREACAMIADSYAPPAEADRKVDWLLCIRDADLSQRIAAAIRARGTHP